MKHGRAVAALIAALAAGLLAGCGPRHIRTPAPSTPDLVVLLPDPSDGKVGRVTVSNTFGTVELAGARESTSVLANRPLTPVAVMSDADVGRIFGDAIAALPPEPQHFILYFRFESDELTDASRALIAEILPAVKARPFPDVAVVGHTDTTGSAAANYELGLKRATAIRRRLTDAGISSDVIDVTSNGESEPLIKTPDQVLERRNRRVEITVR
jgi:outer membrane protein OmpA-like peptidoglycan-associated protein